MAISLHEDMFAITGEIKNRIANIYIGGIDSISAERMEEEEMNWGRQQTTRRCGKSLIQNKK